MSQQWPPLAPNISKDFKKAVEAQQHEVAALPKPALPKSLEQALEQQNKRTAPQLNLNPPGMRRPLVVTNRAQQERVEKMQQRVEVGKGKAREDFGKSAGREL